MTAELLPRGKAIRHNRCAEQCVLQVQSSSSKVRTDLVLALLEDLK